MSAGQSSPKQIGVVGSPSTTTELTIDIVEAAIQDVVLGDMVYLSHPLADEYLLAIGTVGEIETRNRWHEDANMRGVLRVHGELPHLSADGDVRTANVTVQAVYRCSSPTDPFSAPPSEEGGALGMSPTTGGAVCVVSEGLVTGLVERHADAVVYLGRIYKNDVRLPMYVRDFSDPAIDGAFHTGIFGRNGSGKTALASHIMALQLRHPTMGMLVFDPQGQFTTEGDDMPLKVSEWAEGFDRPVRRLSIAEDIALPHEHDLLLELLGETRFYEELGIKQSNFKEALQWELKHILETQTNWHESSGADVLRALLTTLAGDAAAIGRIYVSATPRARLQGVLQNLISDSAAFNRLLRVFDQVHSLFRESSETGHRKAKLTGLIRQLIDPDATIKPYVVIDLSSRPAQPWLASEEVTARLIHTIAKHLRSWSERQWRDTKKLANCVVVFDEGHRFASNAAGDSEIAQLSSYLVSAVRETRKIGIGWTFITQQVSSLHKQIYAQLNVRVFGYGLTTGSDLDLLRDEVGSGGALDLYRSFANPSSRPGVRSYPFMITGPVSPLSFTSAPVFLEVYTNIKEFRKANAHALK